MKAAPILPNEHRVRMACEKFDEENVIVERALKELFTQYRDNDDHAHVLLKVVTLNRLYSTNILAVHDVAKHIYERAQGIDSALAVGSPEIVDEIAKVTIRTTGAVRSNYSFATKYCSWHNLTSYPIWDSRVDRYLRSLRGTTFAKFLNAHGDLWMHYREFVEIMTAFRDHYKLGLFNFKDIDKFLWFCGEKPAARDSDEPPTVLSAGTQI
jgi:hypothetical protein